MFFRKNILELDKPGVDRTLINPELSTSANLRSHAPAGTTRQRPQIAHAPGNYVRCRAHRPGAPQLAGAAGASRSFVGLFARSRRKRILIRVVVSVENDGMRESRKEGQEGAMAMVLVRRLLRAASPNQSRGGGGARGSAVHASGAAPRQVEIRTDREGRGRAGLPGARCEW
jgi:hypothetical protein